MNYVSMLIDTHSHLNFKAFDSDLEEVVKKTLDQDVWVINVGSQYQTSEKAVKIAENYKNGVFAAIGLHPIHVTTDLVEEFDRKKYYELAKSKKVVAIGEIGLDYYYKPKTKIKLELFKEKQKQVFLQQLDLARELNLPVIFHCRMAHDEMIKILDSQIIVSWKKIKGVVHCFTGNLKNMEEYLKMGLYIGFNGIIFKLDLNEAIKQCPLERILIETDCPYLTPPQAGDKRNEPIFAKYVAEKIAELKNMSFQEVAKITTQNARKLFNI